MKVFKINNHLSIVFSDGSTFDTNECTNELYGFIKDNADNEEVVKQKLLPEVADERTLKNALSKSKILTLKGESVYMLDVSECSIPNDLVAKILAAEANNDVAEIQKYKNFWTLVSLNPDERVKDNIFWFLRKWDMKIADSGLIIGYRNAVLKDTPKFNSEQVKIIIEEYYKVKYLEKKDPADINVMSLNNIKSLQSMTLKDAYNSIINGEDTPVYTDAYSHTTTIKLGRPVSIPREDCDANQENSCSQGLHVAAKGWLKNNYFGNAGLMVLVNPAKIVAIPK